MPSTLPARAAASCNSRAPAPPPAGRGRPRRRRLSEAYTWSLVPAAPDRLPLEGRTRSTWPRCARISASACSSRRSETGTPALRRSRCSRSRGLPPVRRAAAGGALARRRHHRGRLLPRQGRRPAALHRALAVPLEVTERGPGRSARADYGEPRRAARRLGLLRVRPGRARARPGRRGPLRRRDHVPCGQAGSRVQRRRVVPRRPDRRRARGGGARLHDLRVFDVYRGEQVGRAEAVALAAAFQSPERTLSDEDAATLRERIVAALAERWRRLSLSPRPVLSATGTARNVCNASFEDVSVVASPFSW